MASMALRLLACGNLKRFLCSATNNAFYFHPTFLDVVERDEMTHGFKVVENFINEAEEQTLLDEIERVLKKIRYEVDHWDAAILGFRETEKKNWSPENNEVLNRVRQLAFNKSSAMSLVHILDLKADGVIKPHVDSVKFCGNTIAGLSLLSSSVMRLSKENSGENTVDILLPRRSLYVMSGCARYDYSHAILANEESFFGSTPVPRTRRISVICRNEPS